MFGTAYTTANSETNTSYEAGIKTSALNGTVHFNAAGFYYNVDHIQLNGNDSNGNGVLFNANKGKGYGLEAEMEARPVQNFRFNVGFSWLHTKIDGNVFAQVGAVNLGTAAAPNVVLAETVLNPVTAGTGGNANLRFATSTATRSRTRRNTTSTSTPADDLPIGGGDSKLFVSGTSTCRARPIIRSPESSRLSLKTVITNRAPRPATPSANIESRYSPARSPTPRPDRRDDTKTIGDGIEMIVVWSGVDARAGRSAKTVSPARRRGGGGTTLTRASRLGRGGALKYLENVLPKEAAGRSVTRPAESGRRRQRNNDIWHHEDGGRRLIKSSWPPCVAA